MKAKHSSINKKDIIMPFMLKLRAKAAEKDQIQRVPIDLVCVIDKSGSMSGENKLDLVKQTFDSILEYLTKNDRVSIIEFDHTVKRTTALTAMNTEGRTETLKAVKDILISGSTNINGALAMAVDVLD
mmetsp:Transcript_39679/g.55341  ORF Transcript_39679/g.55341 Transcript_39679/m.55341 type:complete len:128 (-) Transcript_39679:1009-1392(-)